MDHQSVGLIARGIEEIGIPTIYLGSARDIMAQVKPPRSVFVDFPFGRQCGKPFDRELQRNIIKDALKTLKSATKPAEIIDLPYEWGETFDAITGQYWATKCLPEEGRSWIPETSSGKMTTQK